MVRIGKIAASLAIIMANHARERIAITSRRGLIEKNLRSFERRFLRTASNHDVPTAAE
jgi:hypothetical protein